MGREILATGCPREYRLKKNRTFSPPLPDRRRRSREAVPELQAEPAATGPTALHMFGLQVVQLLGAAEREGERWPQSKAHGFSRRTPPTTKYLGPK
jgi:hypothetical protein